MKALRIGIPCVCQNGHTATYWYRLRGVEMVPEGVKFAEDCDCPKSEFDQGWSLREGYVVTVYDQ